MVLIGLLYENFCDNLKSQKFPDHFIYFTHKQDVLNIEQIDFNYSVSGVNLTSTSIDLSNLSTLSKLN